MVKSFLDTLGVPEMEDDTPLGKTILGICLDMLSAIRSRQHPQHRDHRQHTKDALASILSILSEDKILILAENNNWDTVQAKRAEQFLNQYTKSEMMHLVEIVYCPTKQLRRKSARRNFSLEDIKIGRIMAYVFDFEIKAEDHVEAMMDTKQTIFPKK